MGWLALLKKAVETAGSQAAVAAKLGYSPGTISLVLNNKYIGDLAAFKAKVLKVYGGSEMQEKQVPEGYMENGQGHLVPVESVKPIDKLRDEVVQGLVASAEAISENLASYKKQAFEKITDFVELSAAEYNVELGGKKGNLQLISYNGKYKVTRAIAEHLVFDERLQVAKELIDECLKEWTKDSGSELKAIINTAFKIDQKGRVNTKAILALRKLDIEDERWKRAMDAISDSLTVAGSKAYIRIYKRIDETNEYEQIPLDLSAA